MRPFRSIAPYTIDVPGNESDIVRIIDAISSHKFVGCGDKDLSHIGFEPWSEGEDTVWLKAVDAGVVCKLRVETKKAPASLITQVVKREVSRLEKQGQTVTPEQRSSIKNAVERELSLEALPAYKQIRIYFNERNGVLWIDTINARRQERALEMFGKIFPNTSVTPSLVTPFLPEKFKDFICSEAPLVPKGFRFSGDSRVQVRELGARSGSVQELRHLVNGKSFEVPFVSMSAEGVRFRWHSDGCISHIEHNDARDPGFRAALNITESISNWIS